MAERVAEVAVPFADPPVVGEKTTLKEQVAPCASEVRQVFPVMLKLAEPEPEKLSDGVATVTPVRFCKVTGHAPELAP